MIQYFCRDEKKEDSINPVMPISMCPEGSEPFISHRDRRVELVPDAWNAETGVPEIKEASILVYLFDSVRIFIQEVVFFAYQ